VARERAGMNRIWHGSPDALEAAGSMTCQVMRSLIRRRHRGSHPRRVIELTGASGTVLQVGAVETCSRRSCNRVRISSGVSCVRCRCSRAMMTPAAATPARPARPRTFQRFMNRGPFRE
jgi:hypothetical protein